MTNDNEEKEKRNMNTPHEDDTPGHETTEDDSVEESAAEPVRLAVMSTATLRDFWDMTPEQQREWAENFLNQMFGRKSGQNPRPPVVDGQVEVAEAGGPESDPGSGVDHDGNGPR